MPKKPHGHCLDWSPTASCLIDSHALEALPALTFGFADGRDLPDACLDDLAETMLAELSKNLAALESKET